MGQSYPLGEPFTVAEISALEQHEATIERGLTTFYEVGTALQAIRDARLYRMTHRSFEDYCRDRWGIHGQYGRLLIREARAYENLIESESIDSVLPSDFQIRPLLRLEPEQQRDAWQRAVETAPNGKVTASHVARIVEDLHPRPAQAREDHEDERDGSSALQAIEAGEEEVIPFDRAMAEVPIVGPVPRPAMGVHYSSATPEWYTPKHIIDAVIDVLDEIDLDPCSNSADTPNVPAAYGFTEADDGLSREWFGRVYMNPPYGDVIGAWVDKLHQSYQSGAIETAIALVPARVDTAWFAQLNGYAICFIRGRLRFSGGDNTAPFPSALVYLGDEIDRFHAGVGHLGDVFVRLGSVPGDRTLIDVGDHLGAEEQSL